MLATPEQSNVDRHITVLSNRGPLTFGHHEGQLTVKRGAGGLVATLGPGVEATGALWLAAATSEADRQAAAGGVVQAGGFRARSLVVDAEQYRSYYDVIANATLWYLNHGLFDLPRRPRFDRHWYRAWDDYREVNRSFARAAAETTPDGGVVLIQDYQLALVGAELARLRPDLHTAAFLHTPWCTPAELAVLPERVARELLEGLAGAGAVGFHSVRWAAAFEACCREVLGQVPPLFVSPAAADSDDIRRVAASPMAAGEYQALDAAVGDRQFIVRVDRIELSKNLLRGFYAYEELLIRRPDLRERVVFGAFVYPSRQGLAEYLAYAQEVETLVRRINATWSTPSWTPILYDPSDHYPRSVAALRRADVVLVNPVRDGLNLVAKEAPTVNDRHAVLVLSRTAGAWDELGGHALGVNPYDVTGTAEALEGALSMPPAERAARASGLLAAAAARSPLDWFDDQLAAVSTPVH